MVKDIRVPEERYEFPDQLIDYRFVSTDSDP